MMRILFFLLFLIVFLFPIPYPVSGGASFAYTLSPALAHTEIVTIKMTSKGFEPDTISIDQGSTVIFVNQDEVSRWPASNVHPTHDLYPDFDPKKGIEPNKSWAFKAQKDGVWKFHDHLYPHMRGTVTVLKEANLIVDKTEQKSSWLGNLLADVYSRIKGFFEKKSEVLAADKFVSLTPEKQTEELKKMADSDVSNLWPYLQQAFQGQAGSSGNIHDRAHLVGILTFEKKGFEGIKLCSVDFAFGCYHGFLDRAFKDDLSKLNDAHKACLQLGVSNTVSGPAASCIHGIGHGVASFYQTKDLKGALKTCQSLPSGQEYCTDGVFMEFVRSAPEDAFKKDDPLYPCNTLEEELGEVYSFSCGRNQVNVLSGRFGMSNKEIINICLESTSTPFKHACFDSLGFTFAQSQNVETIIGNCQQIGEDEYEARCLRAAAGELIFQDAPGWPQKSPVICSATASVWQVSCFEHIDNLIREYGKDSSAFLRQQLM